jgi:tetratricopeptide (TPR) repeat protein
MRKKWNRKTRQPSHRAGNSSVAPPAPVLSPGRKWLFRFLTVFVVPLILLAGLELALRLLGVGFDPHFFKPISVAGKNYYEANQDFGLRFFPRNLARTPSPIEMPAKKEAGTFRIFIFGESAALGDPRPNYGAGNYLEVLLAQRFPQAKFEIINTSMTAINSHVILPIAQECARHDGDLWIIYMGNNEMVGPFGAATVFGWRAPPHWLIRTQLQLQRLRLVQLVQRLAQKIHRSSSTPAGWHGMEMFTQNQVSHDDPRRQNVYRNFKRNLDDILNAGHKSGARMILSTVAVNLKDCPPFGSETPPNADCVRLLQDAATAEARGQFTDALPMLQRAEATCPKSAEAQFQLASCLLQLTNGSSLPHFLQAVDDDTLPFRADSDINESIRAASRKFAENPVTLCEATESLKAASPDGIPGVESFYEHVHLNPHGNHALALAWAEQVEKLLPPALKRDAAPSWISQNECEDLLGLTDWNRVSILEEILGRIQRPPFSGQSGSAQRMARLQGEIDELRRHLTNEAAARAQEVYLRALRRAPENFRLHENYAEFLEARKDLKAAIAERKKVCESIPGNYFPYYSLGVDLKEAGDLAEARGALLKADALKPDQADVRLELAIVYARQSEWEMARQELQVARRLNPEEPRIPLYMGEVLWKLNRQDEALASLRESIRLNPSNWESHYRLASDLAQRGGFSEAAAEYKAALLLNPANVKIKLGLASALLQLGQQPEATQQLNEALQLEPDNPAIKEILRKLHGF